MGQKKAAAAGAAAAAAAPTDHSSAARPRVKKKHDAAQDGMLRKADKAMDPRFAAAQTDPRFERFPDKRRTVKVDPRFAGA